MRKNGDYLFRTVKTAAGLIRSGQKDRFRFADDRIIDDLGHARDRSDAERRILFGLSGDTLYRLENRRRYLPIAEIPESVRDAFIAYEDARFYRHRGIDLRSVLRVLAVILARRSLQGASTITMQLAKILFLCHYRRTLRYKLAQIYLAVLLERHFDKDEILELYLNSVYFANRIYGIEAAAEFYLNKSARNLSLSESLYLGAVSQRPVRLNPLKAPDRAERFRQQRLDWFRKNGLITEAQFESAMKDVPVLYARKADGSDLPARFDEIYTVRFDRASGRFGENAQAVCQRLAGAGFSVPVIAGVMGNLHVESGFRADAGISFGDPDAVGLLQWGGERLQALKAAFPEDWQTLPRQIDFLFAEFGLDGAGQEDARAALFCRLALEDGQQAPEYYADLFQALVERNVHSETRPGEGGAGAPAVSAALQGRLSRTPNQYNGKFYLDADRRRNYAKIYAMCIESIPEGGHENAGE